MSPSLKAHAIRDGICPAHKIVVFGGGSVSGIDSDGQFNPDRFAEDRRSQVRTQLGIGSDGIVIGFVGRIVRDKGIHELASAWGALREHYTNAHLVLVGPIEPQDPVDPDVLESLRSDARVHFTGEVADTSELYLAFDVLALPTYREGFGNVNVEAASMRVPVVSTKITGCIDSVLDGVTGTLVPSQDAEALTSAIARYLDDPKLRQDHGQAGRKWVCATFQQNVIWEAVYCEYGRLLTERGIPIPTPDKALGQ